MKKLVIAVSAVMLFASAAYAAYPTNMAVCGDSVSRGACANNQLMECPERAWALGWASGDVCESHIERIWTENPSTIGHNWSWSGADTYNLLTQANNTVTTGDDFVLILMGHNDICADNAAGMTSVAEYTQNYNDAIDTLQAGLPGVKIMVSSLIKMTRIWDVGNLNLGCRLLWLLSSGCNTILSGNPWMRDAALARNIEYNTAMSDLCAEQGVFYDPDVFNIPFSFHNLSSADCFHPTIRFQGLIANATYDATRFN